MVNSDGSYFYKNELYKLGELLDIKEFVDKYGFKSHWNLATYEWYLYKDYLQIFMYREWGSFVASFIYVPDKKLSSVYNLGFVNGIETEKDCRRIYNEVSKIIANDDYFSQDKLEVLSFLKEVEFFYQEMLMNPLKCSEMFEAVEDAKVNVYTAEDRIKNK